MRSEKLGGGDDVVFLGDARDFHRRPDNREPQIGLQLFSRLQQIDAAELVAVDPLRAGEGVLANGDAFLMKLPFVTLHGCANRRDLRNEIRERLPLLPRRDPAICA